MKILMTDIHFYKHGFWVEKITKGESKLSRLEENLDEIRSVQRSNIDDMGCLSVSWFHPGDLTEFQKDQILKIIQKIF